MSVETDMPRDYEDELTRLRGENEKFRQDNSSLDSAVEAWRAETERLRAEVEQLSKAYGLTIMERDALRAERDGLKSSATFAVAIMREFWQPPDVGSLDGWDLQELAHKHGMLAREDVPEGGCGEGCNCIGDGAEPGDDCYRLSGAGKEAIVLVPVEKKEG